MTNPSIKGSAVLDTVRVVKARAGEDGFRRILDALDPEGRSLFQGAILSTEWYPLDAFAGFLGANIRETAGGDERVLVERSAAVVENQLRGIYRLFVRLGSPDFVLRRVSIIHSNFFKGVDIQRMSYAPGRAVIRYSGFRPQHRLLDYVLIGFYRKALEISGAGDVQVSMTTSIGESRGYAELEAIWTAR